VNAVTGPSTATPRAAGGALGRYAPWAALLVGLVVTWGLWSYAKASAEARARIEFDFRVADVRRAVAQRMDTYAELLRGAAGLFDAGLAPDRNAWHLYVQSLDIDRTYPGIFGIGYAPLVGGTDREAFEAAVGMRDGEPFAIVPAGRRDAYAPVLYLEPLRAANRRIIGADMFSAPGRREALERSRDRGAPAMTGVVQLMQNKGERTQPGFLVYFPIYRGGMRPGTVEERRRTLQGWVYGPFHASDLMKGVLGANPEGLEIEIDDVTAGSERLFGGPSSTPGDSGSLSSRTKLSIFDRDWQITVNAPGGAQTFSDRMAAAHGFAAGSLGLTLLLFLLVRNLAHTRERAEDIDPREEVAAPRTADPLAGDVEGAAVIAGAAVATGLWSGMSAAGIPPGGFGNQLSVSSHQGRAMGQVARVATVVARPVVAGVRNNASINSASHVGQQHRTVHAGR